MSKRSLKDGNIEKARNYLYNNIPSEQISSSELYHSYIAEKMKLNRPKSALKHYLMIPKISNLYEISGYETIFVYDKLEKYKEAINLANDYIADFRENKDTPNISMFLPTLYLKSGNTKMVKFLTKKADSQIRDLIKEQSLLRIELADNFTFPGNYNYKLKQYLGNDPTFTQFIENEKNPRKVRS